MFRVQGSKFKVGTSNYVLRWLTAKVKIVANSEL